MARVFTDGAEFGDTLFLDMATSGVAGTARTGSYSYDMSGTSYKDISALSEFYTRFGWYGTGVASIYMLKFQNGGTLLNGVYIDASYKLVALVGGGGVGTSTNAITISGWNLIEVYMKIADSGGRFVIKLNGLTEVDYTGDTKPGADTEITRLQWGSWGTRVGYLDDWALNDTTGGVDDSWCGDGHIEVLMPNGNGDVNDWTGNDADKTDNYLLVDERPKDNDTTYVYSSTPAEQDMYNVSDFSGSGKIIERVFAECRARDAQYNSGEIKIGFKAGATVSLCASSRVLSGTYDRIVGDEALINPDDSASWEDADLDAIQFVAECE